MFVFASQKHYSSEDKIDYEYFVETSLDLIRDSEEYKLIKKIESELERKVFTITKDEFALSE